VTPRRIASPITSERLGLRTLANNHSKPEGEPAEDPSFKDEEKTPISRIYLLLSS
jgi:hypothetical protein